MNEEERFEADVAHWLSDILKSQVTFGEIVRRLPGVDPVVVQRLLASGSTRLSEHVVWSDASHTPADLNHELPVPHPLDFDWRFTPATLSSLKREIVGSYDRITLLGTPSLWLALREHLAPQNLVLLDANPLLTAAAKSPRDPQLVVTDIMIDPLPQGASDLVFADPPWYPEALTGFLWAASALVRRGGTVLLSAPPIGTRPSVIGELEALLKWVGAAGLTLRTTRHGAVRYSMPPFECAALRAGGLLKHVPSDWRQGDILEFVRTGNPGPRPHVTRRRRWSEREVRGVRIQIDDAAEQTSDDPRPVELLPGDVLPSVSRRDPRRAQARVWTSGNRVFGCAAPRRLLEITQAVQSGQIADAIRSPADHDAAQAIVELVSLEQAEYICSVNGRMVPAAPSPSTITTPSLGKR